MEQKKCVYSVLEQTVLTPDGILIIRIHAVTEDATSVYKDLIDRYGKSTAAQLAASDLEADLSLFKCDTTWTKTNLAFLTEWTTKTLDLDSVLVEPITDSQKRIWFTRAVAPSKAVLSLAISQFDTSERLTCIAMGPTYVKTLFSILYEHVKDMALHADNTNCLLQGNTRCAHEAHTTPPPDSQSTSNRSSKSTCMGKDGQQHNYVIPPEEWKTLSPAELIMSPPHPPARRYGSH
jgi:hypothetical protein